MSRIRYGWRLEENECLRTRWASIFDNDSLKVRETVRLFLIALKRLEDAFIAVDSDSLALFLARTAVEKCYEAAFASRDFLYVGSKWLRIVENVGLEMFAPLHRDGLSLLFPGRDTAASGYLEAVWNFTNLCRKFIEEDPHLRIALAMTKQIGMPVIPRFEVGLPAERGVRAVRHL
jgi:hypothetical protein